MAKCLATDHIRNFIVTLKTPYFEQLIQLNYLQLVSKDTFINFVYFNLKLKDVSSWTKVVQKGFNPNLLKMPLSIILLMVSTSPLSWLKPISVRLKLFLEHTNLEHPPADCIICPLMIVSRPVNPLHSVRKNRSGLPFMIMTRPWRSINTTAWQVSGSTNCCVSPNAIEQLLSYENIAFIQTTSVITIKCDMAFLRRSGLTIPSHEWRHDMGLDSTHKTQILDLYHSGYQFSEIEKHTHHSETAVK